MTSFTVSKSYPYLSIAREFGIDYGIVLAYADVLNKPSPMLPSAPTPVDHWELQAVHYANELPLPKFKQFASHMLAVRQTLRGR